MTTGGARSAGPSARPETAEDRGPRVQLWTTDEFGSRNRVRPSFRLAEDAYVIVVNVGLDGYASVIFPESPEDDGFMRGGRTYRLPPFFPGFANTFSRTRYGRLYHATSAYDDIYDRYAGYVFIIASWRPMHFRVTEALGLWDDHRLAVHDQMIEPSLVMHEFAEKLVPGRRDYTARFARYAAFNNDFGRPSAFATCAAYGWPIDFSNWVLTRFYRPSVSVPAYGHGYYSCLGPRLIRFRPLGRRLVPAPTMPPVKPVPGDSAGPGRPVKPPAPRSPVAEDDGGQPRGPRRRSGVRPGRGADVATEPQIIDVTKESRAVARRQERAERARRAIDGSRGYQRPDRWNRPDRSRDYERASSRRDGARDDAPRARRPEPADNARARAEHPRGERPTAPRGAESPRAEPRSQPVPRRDPPARSESAARSDPRERSPKPERQ